LQIFLSIIILWNSSVFLKFHPLVSEDNKSIAVLKLPVIVWYRQGLIMVKNNKNKYNVGPVTDFLDCYSNKKTVSNYQSAVAHYIRFVTETPNANYCELDMLAASYLERISDGIQNVVHDLKRFSGYLEKKYSPAYRSLILTITGIWLDDMDVKISSRKYRRIMPRFASFQSIREETEMSSELFIKFYQIFPRWCSTLLVVMLGTGMRIGEALQINKSDISWSEIRPIIHIRAEITKTKEARKVFLTSEAACELQNYLLNRHDEDPRVFPFRVESAQFQMRCAADKLGYGGTRLRSVHWHMTRKWFISQFSLAASKEVAEELAGHKGYLSSSYRRYSQDDLMTEFLKAESTVSIFSNN